MPKAMSPVVEIDATAKLLSDPNNPIFRVIDYIAKYSLPIKPIASFLSIHPQTLYFWIASEDDIRAESNTLKKMDLLLERLSTAEDAGQLVLTGTASTRNQQLIEALGDHAALEPETT